VAKIPLVAIGGINLANAPEVVAAGADALCAISAVVGSGDVRGEIEKFQRCFGDSVRGGEWKSFFTYSHPSPGPLP
jgi:thiamine monophosphate synthase